MQLRPLESRSWRFDVIVAATFVAWVVLEVLTHAVAGPPVRNLVTGLLATAPLVLRRRLPEVAGLACTSGVVLKTSFGSDMDGMAMLSALFVASYAVGRHVPGRRGPWVVAAMVAMVWSVLWLPDNTGPYDWMFTLIWVGGPGLAGALLRRQLHRTAAAADRAARAELLRDQHARSAVRAERDRIAREVHDTVAHAVSVMVLQAGAVRSRLPEGLDPERRALADSEDTGRRAIADLGRLLSLLRSEVSDGAEVTPAPTLAALEELVNQTRALGIDVDLRVDGAVGELDSAMQVSAYRIVQEALTNIRKHAGADHAVVTVSCMAAGVSIEVSDDGRGPRPAEASQASPRRGHGHGLLGVRERVEVYGGDLSLGRTPSGGFLLHASLPRAAP